MVEALKDTLLLLGLGCLGWLVFTKISLPTPALLGTIAVVGTLRMIGYQLPMSPEIFSPMVQVFLGYYVGSKVNRNTLHDLKSMMVPAVIIVIWALSVVFIMGYFISQVTHLDSVTAILSSSMGGLPEMTIIALATNADIAVVIIMQTLRMVATIIVFPLILKIWMKYNDRKNDSAGIQDLGASIAGSCKTDSTDEETQAGVPSGRISSAGKYYGAKITGISLKVMGRCLLSLSVAALGGWLFLSLGVPAGGMVGAMFFVSLFALAFNMVVETPSSKIFGFILVGIGLMVSDNLSVETIDVFLTENIIFPLIISTALIFISSFVIALLIHGFTGWDFPTSFLAAAPGGFTVMTTLAIKYDKNPFNVSMLHLCRLLAIKSVVPFVFMLYV